MAGQTPRFQLNFFDDETPGSFDDDSNKFTGDDRIIIDRVLSALENHNHRFTTQLAEPGNVPNLSQTGDGQLSAGRTYFYVISFVNADGLETAAGPEASIVMPNLLPVPTAPSGETATTGGTLPPGQYFYALTGIRGEEESPLGDPFLVTVLDDEDSVELTLPPLAGATLYQVWRMADTDSGWTRIGTTSSINFTDDGSVPAGAYGDPSNIPPTTNNGVNAYSVTIALTGSDLTQVQTSAAWRIYRTETSGSYSATSLVHEVVERQNDLDPTSALLTSWVDDGDVQLTGTPKLFSQELNIPPFTVEWFTTALPDPTGYPNGYPALDEDGHLVHALDGDWVPAAAPGGGGGGNVEAATFYKGAWNSATNYLTGNWVKHDDTLYAATSNNTNSEPGAPPGGGGPPTLEMGFEAAPATSGTTWINGTVLAGFIIDADEEDEFEINGGTIEIHPSAGTLGATARVSILNDALQEIAYALITPQRGTNPFTLAAPVTLIGAGTYAVAVGQSGATDTTAWLKYANANTASAGSPELFFVLAQDGLDPVFDSTLLFTLTAGAPVITSPWTEVIALGTTQRGVATFTGHGPPTPPPADALTGDIYIDLDTGDIYEIEV